MNSKPVWKGVDTLDTRQVDDLARKEAGMPLIGPESLYGIENRFMAATLENEEE